jgi:hypothetical protein
MKLKNGVITGLVVAVVAIGVGTWVGVSNTNPTPVATHSQVQSDPTTISYVAEAHETSLKQLKDEAKNVVTEQSKYGEYVSAIGSHKGGTDGKYWSFYIDGKLASVGADSYVQKGGEHIVWKFQKL